MQKRLMQKRLMAILAALIFGGILTAPPRASAGYLVGGPLQLSVYDSPIGTDFNQTITIGDGTTTLDAGEMTVTQTLVPAGAGVEWLVLDFEATGGRLLAGDPNAYWSIQYNAQLASPGYETGRFFYWAVDGAATSPIYPFLTITGIETNPLDPSGGQVYGNFNPPGGAPLTAANFSLFVTPYSAIAGGGMNINKVNGIVIGLQVTDASVPEPSSLTLGALGAVAIGGIAWGRRPGRIRDLPRKATARDQHHR